MSIDQPRPQHEQAHGTQPPRAGNPHHRRSPRPTTEAPGRYRHRPKIAVAAIVVFFAGAQALMWTWFAVSVAPPSGAQTPTGAALSVIHAVQDTTAGDQVSAHLCEESAPQLRELIRTARRDITRAVGSGSVRFETRTVSTRPDGDQAATVTHHLAAVTAGGGSGLSVRGPAHPWTFTARRDSDGWHVCGVDMPGICTVYLDCDPDDPGTGPEQTTPPSAGRDITTDPVTPPR